MKKFVLTAILDVALFLGSGPANAKELMCGIVGVTSNAGRISPESLNVMRDTMQHRGPDDAGSWWSSDGSVGLAHRRLAIIDLSMGGHQPMVSTCGKFIIVFNGEIYNYQKLRSELEQYGWEFRSKSDTEVILAAYQVWGLDCVIHFNGMFAFALYDHAARRLFLARDRAGEKPLFYYLSKDGLSFASELKAFLCNPQFPREIDLEALNHYLTYGYVPGELCMLKGFRKLKPGHAITYDVSSGEMHVWSYWQLPDPPSAGTISDGELMEEFQALLTSSVQMRLIADVPLGILLSGGLDSSLITALALGVSSRSIKTFTISFPGHGQYDEGPYAKLVASHLGAEHTELVAEPTTIDLLPDMAAQFDEPMADSSMIPTYLVSRLIRQHATVALGGDGGDELFGGYLHYSWIQHQERLRRLVPRIVRAWTGLAASHVLPYGFRGRNHLIGFSGDTSQSVAHINMFLDLKTRSQLLSPNLRDAMVPGISPEQYKNSLCNKGQTPLQQATSVDFKTYMVDDILVKVDRSSMLASLEVRAPFLDHRLIEFAFGRLPDTLRATESERKILPHRLAHRLLPQEFDATRKQGFSLPLNSWFKGQWGAYVESVLHEIPTSLFNRAAIERLIHSQHRGYSNTQRLFALTLFELWRRHYGIAIPGG